MEKWEKWLVVGGKTGKLLVWRNEEDCWSWIEKWGDCWPWVEKWGKLLVLGDGTETVLITGEEMGKVLIERIGDWGKS